MDEHEHHHGHDHDHPHAPETQDAGSQALAEALRSSFAIVKVVMVLMVIAFFASGIFQVGPWEKAVILRLGKPVGEGQKQLLGNGLHWSLPYPIDEVVKIPITENQHVRSTAGWYFTTPEQELTGEALFAGQALNPAIDGYALTADTNIVHVQVTLYYRIEDPIRAVFGFSSDTNFAYGITGVSNAVQNVLNNALLYTAAHFNVDDILTRNVSGFNDAVQQRVEDLLEAEKLGVTVDHCDIIRAAPRQLQDIFAQVATANQNRDTALNTARSLENKILSGAGSQASSITNAAEIARNRYVTALSADAKKFSDLLPQYRSNPNLFVQVQLAQTMQQALTNVEKWIVPTSDNGKSTEVRLQLNREPPAPKASANP
jgi:membrane protease subunit HflK